ncbi:MAG: hypothetical protein ACTTJV_04875 [Ottowia sp.]
MPAAPEVGANQAEPSQFSQVQPNHAQPARKPASTRASTSDSQTPQGQLSTIRFKIHSALRSVYGRFGRFAQSLSKILYPNMKTKGQIRPGHVGHARRA